MNKIAAMLAVGALALTACGSDDGGGGGGGGDAARTALLAQLNEDAPEGLDQSCLEEKVNGLSDSDAVFISENLDYEGDEPPPGASEDALAFVSSLIDCLDLSGLGVDE